MQTFIPNGNVSGPIVPSFVLRESISPGAKLLYTVLCDHANTKDHCYPSQKYLAQKLGYSVSSIKNWLAELVQVRLVRIQRSPVRSSSLYFLLRPREIFSLSSKPAQSVRGSQTLATPQANFGYRNNFRKSLENIPPLPPAKPGQPVDSSFQEHRKRGGGEFLSANMVFERFWAIYPRKEAKELARAAWHRLWRQRLLPALSVLMAALEKFRASAMWLKEHGRFVPQLSNWLKGQRWLDEISDAGASLAPEEKARQEQAQYALAHFEQQEQARQARHEAETARLRPDFEKFLSRFSDGSQMRGPAWGLWCLLHRRGKAPKAADVPYSSQCGVYEFLKNFEMENCHA